MRMMGMWRVRVVVVSALLCVIMNSPLWAQGFLESPQNGSFQRGVSLIRGWNCEPALIQIQIDDGPFLTAAHGTSRQDTLGVRGDENNGWVSPGTGISQEMGNIRCVCLPMASSSARPRLPLCRSERNFSLESMVRLPFMDFRMRDGPSHLRARRARTALCWHMWETAQTWSVAIVARLSLTVY